VALKLNDINSPKKAVKNKLRIIKLPNFIYF
jgi:hypothetical protein